jgi:hypothetical protein
MKLTLQTSALVVLAVLGIRFWWLPRHDRAVAREVRHQDSVQVWQGVLDSVMRLTGRLTGATIQLAAHAHADSVRAAASRQTFHRLSRRADSTAHLLDALQASLPDTAPLALAIIAQRQAGAACLRALEDCETRTTTLTARAAALDSLVQALQPALDRTTSMWQAAERRGRRRVQLRPGAGACAVWSPGDGAVRAGPCAFVGLVF